MDPILAKVIKEFIPIAAVLVCGIVPVTIVGLVQHFRHKREELQLERDLRMAMLANERLALEIKSKQLDLAGGSGVQPPLAEPAVSGSLPAKTRTE